MGALHILFYLILTWPERQLLVLHSIDEDIGGSENSVTNTCSDIQSGQSPDSYRIQTLILCSSHGITRGT